MKNSYKTLLLAIGLLLVATALCLIVFHKNANPQTAGLTKVRNFHAHGVCAALSPECGLCYGKVIAGACYVDKTKLTSEQMHEMGLP